MITIIYIYKTKMEMIVVPQLKQKQLTTCKKYICVCSSHQRGKKKEERERNSIPLEINRQYMDEHG